MDNLENVLTLAKAGYSRAEIENMLAGTKTPEETKQPETQEQPAEAPQKPAEEAETKPAKKTAEKTEDAFMPFIQPSEYKELLEAMKSLTAGLIKTNLNRDGFDSTPEQTAEAALASIIRPKKGN